MHDLHKQWDIEKNLPLLFSDVSAKSKKKTWWKCDLGHSWQARVDSRTSGNGCPVCANKIIISGVNDLATLNPDLASEWDTILNNVEVYSVASNSGRKAWWRCHQGHSWDAVIASRNSGVGCPVCSGNKVLSGYNDLLSTYPLIAAEWHSSLNTLDSNQITSVSGRKAWWIGKCGHEWEAIVANRTKHGYGCPYCSNQKLLEGYNDLLSCYPDIASDWHIIKNTTSPNQHLYGSNVKVWWLAGCGHEWKTSIHNRVKSGTGCPTCSVSGFKPDKESKFYFIQNLELSARKIGITNSSSKRLKKWISQGWTIILLKESENGHDIRRLETLLKQWIRKDLGLMPELTNNDMGGQAGFSETFTIHTVTNAEIINKINEINEIYLV